MCDDDFFKMLREEMLQVRRSRFQCHLAKVTAVGSLIGAGVLLMKPGNPQTGPSPARMLFYVVPFVAIVFDVFALGESFTMRRMHAFVKECSSGTEKRWQMYVDKHPNRYTTWGNMLITALFALGCGGMIWLETRALGPLVLWALSLAVAMGIIWWRQQRILLLPGKLPRLSWEFDLRSGNSERLYATASCLSRVLVRALIRSGN